MSVSMHETPSKPKSSRDLPQYEDIVRPYTDVERQQLAEVKRFFECYEGDKDLRDALKAGQVKPEQRALLKEIGITFELEELEPVWKNKEMFDEALADPESPAAQNVVALVESYPLLNLWATYKMRRAQAYVEQRTWLTSTPADSPRYHAWRMRRIAATKSELGFYGYEIDHPALAIEMQVGCSVGCYFCAFDAPKLQKVFDYNVPENKQLFQEVALSLRTRLGWSSGHALLYWSTEPADNPHYIQYMKLYKEITGSSVCTATARADEKWVSDLLAHYGPMNQPWPRISVLTRSIMYKIHKRFTPWEARDMVLLMQQKDGEESRLKVPGGRDKMLNRLNEYTDLRDLDTGRKPEDLVVPQGSIACVSGFLINVIEKTIKLISPCYTTQEHRYGYRVFDSVTFTDGADFDRQLTNMIERKCVFEPYDAMPMKFRDDLRYRPRPDGFQVTTRQQVHECVGNEVYAPLGEMLNQGTMTYAEVMDTLVERHGCNPMMAAAVIKGMFDEGFLSEIEVSSPVVSAGSDSVLELTH